MGAIKQFVKKSVNMAVSISAPIKWKFNNNSLLVLMYHRIIPPGHSSINIMQPGMYVYPETLRMHLEILKSKFDIVHLDDWIQSATNGETLPKNACAITFDDGWSDNYTYAYPILQEQNIPATIYLVSDMIGTSMSFWPERVLRLFNNYKTGKLKTEIVDSDEFKWIMQLQCINGKKESLTDIDTDILMGEMKLFPDAFINNKLDKIDEIIGYIPLCEEPDILNLNQIMEMKQSGLVKFGSHTCSHARMLKLNEIDLINTEIIDSRKKLDKLLDIQVNSFCYPNGDCSETAEGIVHNHYLSACTTQPGWNNKFSDFYRLKRIGIHQNISQTKNSFLSRISGWI